jgi:NTP pyrophosphatase (non-canonical NTP hydrolase)
MTMVAEELEKYAPIEIILKDVKDERQRQNDKWDNQPEWWFRAWVAILGEEFGEVCEAMLDIHETDTTTWEHLYEELIQVAAVAVAQAQKLRKALDHAAA